MTELIDEIKTAYKLHGLRPMRGLFFWPGKRYDFACPLVALAIHRGVVKRDDPDLARDDAANAAVEWAAQTLGEEWTLGFLDGFDRQSKRLDNREYDDGFDIGVALAYDILPGAAALGL
jgi:hypothetical protein